MGQKPRDGDGEEPNEIFNEIMLGTPNPGAKSGPPKPEEFIVCNPEEIESLKSLVHPKLAALAAQLYPDKKPAAIPSYYLGNQQYDPFCDS